MDSKIVLLSRDFYHTVSPWTPAVCVPDICLLHRAYSHMERQGRTVRVMFCFFSSPFNTLLHFLIVDKLSTVQMEYDRVVRMTDNLTSKPQDV